MDLELDTKAHQGAQPTLSIHLALAACTTLLDSIILINSIGGQDGHQPFDKGRISY